jgi:hypothetical protein
VPFAGYENFDACVSANGDKGDAKAYCGYVKHRAEGGLAPRTAAAPSWVKAAEREVQAASSLSYPHEVVDPNNAEVPQADQFSPESMFPLNPAFQGEWETGPGGAQPKGGQQQKEAGMRASGGTHRLFGRMDAMEGKQPRHKSDYSAIFSDKGHGQYLRSYNEMAGMVHTMSQRTPWTQKQYAEMTGRPDLHKHYMGAYADATAQRNLPAGTPREAVRRHADTLTRPHQTTDDFAPPFNSAATTPQPSPGQNSSDGDYQAGFSEGQQDARTSQRPTFMDNSSKVSPYVKGYAEGYAAAGQQYGTQDTPMSLGGDSGQAQNAQEAGTQFQVSKASLRASAAFVTPQALAQPDFTRGYRYALNWKGGRLVSQGSAAFEAGLYAGITDNPRAQETWAREHDRLGSVHAVLSDRLDAHEGFTRRYARANPSVFVRGLYVQAGSSTDLITDGPGTSPDPMGSTPINGPGTPPQSGGRGNPGRPGGASPYQGAEPHGGGPVVSDDVAGPAQEPAKPDGKPQMGFSGPGPGYTNINLAPAAPNDAAGPGYSNAAADQGNPHHDGRQAAFRAVVQSRLAKMREQS